MAAGIFLIGTWHPSFPLHAMLVGLVLLALMLGIALCFRSYPSRWWFGALLSVLMLAVGSVRYQCQWERVNVDWPENRRTHVGQVMEPPVLKPRSVWCNVKLSQGRSVYLYLAKDSLSQRIRMGDHLMFQARIRKPDNEGLTFDYASYLLHKGISGTAYSSAAHWMKMPRQASLSLKQKALLVRENILQCYREWGIGEAQRPVLSALTVGYKADLSDELRDAYSVAGVSHVLALSGMHVGFLWMMIALFLKPLDRSGLRWLKWLVSTVLLWMFAFVAGLEASVVRAVLMCMLMELGRLSRTPSLSLHTLAIAAFFMLLYNPFYLFDVGFQLSFLAVLSILMLHPLFQARCPFRGTFLRGLWRTVSVTVSAQLGTAPLVMHYFSNFSPCFLLANLGIVWMVPAIIYTAFLSMVMHLCMGVPPWMAGLLDKMVSWLNAWVSWLGTWP